MTHRDEMTRREALGLLGIGGASLALPALASAATPIVQRGAVIRTVLKDYAPEDLAGGATLFHEHMSLADDFMTRWIAQAADTRRENALPGSAAAPTTQAQPAALAGKYFMQDLDYQVEEMRIAKREGISCIVD